jgi:hypothetical protein
MMTVKRSKKWNVSNVGFFKNDASSIAMRVTMWHYFKKYWHAIKWSVSFSQWQCPSDGDFSFPRFVVLLILSLCAKQMNNSKTCDKAFEQSTRNDSYGRGAKSHEICKAPATNSNDMFHLGLPRADVTNLSRATSHGSANIREIAYKTQGRS